jgi:hypothetical protein
LSLSHLTLPHTDIQKRKFVHIVKYFLFYFIHYSNYLSHNKYIKKFPCTSARGNLTILIETENEREGKEKENYMLPSSLLLSLSSLSYSLSRRRRSRWGGGVWLVRCRCCTCSLSLSSLSSRFSPFPPHEQLLAAVVGGEVVVVAVIILVVSSPLLSRGGGTGSSLSVLTSLPHLVVVVQSVFCPLPVCTPQGVACGGCCGGSGGGALPSSLLLAAGCRLSVTSSTHDPPCEQWLAAVVAGAGSLGHYLFRGSSDVAGIWG